MGTAVGYRKRIPDTALAYPVSVPFNPAMITRQSDATAVWSLWPQAAKMVCQVLCGHNPPLGVNWLAG